MRQGSPCTHGGQRTASWGLVSPAFPGVLRLELRWPDSQPKRLYILRLPHSRGPPPFVTREGNSIPSIGGWPLSSRFEKSVQERANKSVAFQVCLHQVLAGVGVSITASVNPRHSGTVCVVSSRAGWPASRNTCRQSRPVFSGMARCHEPLSSAAVCVPFNANTAHPLLLPGSSILGRSTRTGLRKAGVATAALPLSRELVTNLTPIQSNPTCYILLLHKLAKL